MDRRSFLQCLAIAGTAPSVLFRSHAASTRRGSLRTDRRRILDLPEGFHYDVVSQAGAPMDDGLVVPHAHDGMAAFPGKDGRVILVCNHELAPAY